MIPGWWAFVLLSLAAFRIWKLIADDVIFDRLRDRVLMLYETRPDRASAILGFLACGWCLGFWVSGLWWLAWLLAPTMTLVVATPWAIAAVVGLLVEMLPNSDPV